MKTIRTLLTLSAVAIVAIATAVERPKMNVTPLTANLATVSITNENAAYFELSIKSENGETIYYKESSKPITDYKKTYDFTNLENGNYEFSLRVNDTQLSKKFAVSNHEISVGEQKLRFDPYFSFTNNELKFSFLNFDQENVSMNIYNSEGLVFEKKIGNDFTISKGFNLAKLEPGKYTVYLSSSSDEYVYNLVK